MSSRELLPSSSFVQPPDTGKRKILKNPRDALHEGGGVPFLVHASPLHGVAVNGERDELLNLISSNAYDLDCGDQFGRTPLVDFSVRVRFF